MHTKNILESIVDKNYNKAKTFIHEAMKQRVALILEQELERLAGGLLQEKKMDPVGEEDGDINNDGEEGESDKYLANRRKVIAEKIAKKKK